MYAISGRVITVSDRCAAGERPDVSGPTAARLLTDAGVRIDRVVVVPDSVPAIREAISDALRQGCRLILTTGGTGIGPRDVTPEATETFIIRRMDGLAEQIRRAGISATPTAVLSRGLAGLTASDGSAALVVNTPGSVGGVSDAAGVLTPLLDHIFDQLVGGDHG